MPTASATTTKTVSVAFMADAVAVLAALTDGAQSPAYYYGFAIDSTFEPSADYSYTAGGMEMISGTITEVEPGTSLTMTFNGKWDPAVAALPQTEVTYSLAAPHMPSPGVTVLTMNHRGMPDGATADNVELGWVLILSGLKTLVETGAPLVALPSG
jgi:uncharacterized protein YndB with AHSA1/START domain